MVLVVVYLIVVAVLTVVVVASLTFNVKFISNMNTQLHTIIIG